MIGDGNRFAHAAALAVAELPGPGLQPALPPRPARPRQDAPAPRDRQLRRALRRRPAVRYATVEEFTTEFVEAVRRKATADFKQRFRGADVLLIDDIQFLAGRAQDARGVLPHLQRALRGRPPARHHERPRARGHRRPRGSPAASASGRGLVAELETPELEVRLAILASAPASTAWRWPTTRSPRSPATSTTSVRALEGALIRVVAYASLRGEPPTPALARHVLRRSRRRRDTGRTQRQRDPRRDRRRSSAVPLERAARPRPQRRRSPSPARSPCTSRAS